MLALILAAIFAFSPVPDEPRSAAQADAAELAAAPSETDISLRRGRLAAFIRSGWHAGWLDRPAMDEAFAKLRANRRLEDDLRAEGGGKRLTETQRRQLSAGLDNLSEGLRHARARHSAQPRRML